MPTALPGMSVTEAQRILQVQDRMLRGFPEVERVFGKAGRATSPTDPAPFSMVETTVLLKPESEWRPVQRWYSDYPRPLRWLFSIGLPEHRHLRRAARRDGRGAALPRHPEHLDHADPEPHRHALDRRPHADRHQGPRPGPEGHPAHRRGARGRPPRTSPARATSSPSAPPAATTSTSSSSATRSPATGCRSRTRRRSSPRRSAARPVTTTVEGRERYSVNVRYGREFRDNVHALRRVLVPTPSGAQVPMAQIADIQLLEGPSMIRDENGQLAGYVFVDMAGRDVGGYVQEAKQRVQEQARPAGRLHAGLERAVREPGPRARAAEGGDPAHARAHRAAALPEHEIRREDGDRAARRAVLAGRRRLAALRRSATTCRSRSGSA